MTSAGDASTCAIVAAVVHIIDWLAIFAVVPLRLLSCRHWRLARRHTVRWRWLLHGRKLSHDPLTGDGKRENQRDSLRRVLRRLDNGGSVQR